MSPAVVLHYPSHFVLTSEWVGWVIKGEEKKKKKKKKKKINLFGVVFSQYQRFAGQFWDMCFAFMWWY